MDATRVSDQQSYANPTVRLVDHLLLDAVKNRASDIHLEPEQHFVRVRHRIDGALRQVILFHERHWAAICVRLKILANMDIAETRMPQSGRFSLKVGVSDVDFRVATHPTYFGENMVLRLLDKTNGVRSLEHLGLSKKVVARLRGVLKIPQGLMVVTGPTGSGKTTTLYALLQELGMMSRNLMTLEQPIEYQLPLVRQAEIQEQGRLTFADGVRSLLRQDPDVMLIGEVRDAETAHMALRAAMTGHQVYTTLHTGSSFGVVHRLVNLGQSLESVLSALQCVISQRLIRRRCMDCSEKENTNCARCQGSGYRGRVPLCEVLVFDDALRQLYLKSAPLEDLKQHACQQGFVSLREQAHQLVREGITTEEEVHIVLGEEVVDVPVSL